MHKKFRIWVWNFVTSDGLCPYQWIQRAILTVSHLNTLVAHMIDKESLEKLPAATYLHQSISHRLVCDSAVSLISSSNPCHWVICISAASLISSSSAHMGRAAQVIIWSVVALYPRSPTVLPIGAGLHQSVIDWSVVVLCPWSPTVLPVGAGLHQSVIDWSVVVLCPWSPAVMPTGSGGLQPIVDWSVVVSCPRLRTDIKNWQEVIVICAGNQKHTCFSIVSPAALCKKYVPVTKVQLVAVSVYDISKSTPVVLVCTGMTKNGLHTLVRSLYTSMSAWFRHIGLDRFRAGCNCYLTLACSDTRSPCESSGKVSASSVRNTAFNPRPIYARNHRIWHFSGLSCYEFSALTGCSGGSIQWLGEISLSLTCRLSFSVATPENVQANHSLRDTSPLAGTFSNHRNKLVLYENVLRQVFASSGVCWLCH